MDEWRVCGRVRLRRGGTRRFNTQIFALLGSMDPGTHAAVGSFTTFQFVRVWCWMYIFYFNVSLFEQTLGSAVGFYWQVPLPLHGSGGTFAQLYLQVV